LEKLARLDATIKTSRPEATADERALLLMSKRFVCQFAVGRKNLAYSGIWRVWTAKNTPDLYLAAQSISGELKATVHCPRPPHFGWKGI
jgi:hypothetical protein